ncbi:carboxypeptidase Y-deficient [Coemansia guatemalensis]|uniref:Carboxypeptidase Y-deficient n=1 Tax=Coemansia guatemalensis TaxID=2761395 RepID=A0A9W8HXM6_9FUNG|nr:carboxypeptidase Y-deficient [Coemansia guatemalensis]
MSQTSSPRASPLRKEASIRHVRRAARTLGPAASPNLEGSAADTPSTTASDRAPRPMRSQSTIGEEAAMYPAGGDSNSMRRSTISLGSLQPSLAGRPGSISSSSNSSSRRASGVFGDDGTASGDTLRCPICGVMAPSLFALNMHLDDTHFAGEGGGMERARPAGGLEAEGIQTRYASQDDLEEVKGAILGFFRGAGKAVRGLSGAAQTMPMSAATSNHNSESPAADVGGGEVWRAGERDGADRDMVTRTHWQQQRAGMRCGLAGCGITLTPQTGMVNCRSCGRLMCGQHCSWRMRLSPTAQAAGPGRGVACRVCEECHARTIGSTAGQTRSHMRGFAHMRRKAVSSATLEGTRLEKRLEKLALVHGTPGLTGAHGRALQEAEQAVVAWEDDADVADCPFCAKAFGRVASRRHHCRLCGRVVCGRAGCSALLGVPLPVPGGQGFSASHRADIRACRTCEGVIIRHRDRLARAAPQASALIRLYTQVRTAMALVEETLPTFNALATRLRNHAAAPDLPRAARIRRQLTAAFNGMDHASKCIAALPADDATSKRLHNAIRRTVSQYLQLHMFPLTMLPKPARRPHSLLQPDSSPRAPTPLRVQTAPGTANGSEAAGSPAGSLPLSTSTFSADGQKHVAARGSTSDNASAESSTANEISSPLRDITAAADSHAEGQNTDGSGGTKATLATGLTRGVSGAATGIASSLLSYVVAAKPKADNDAAARHDELVQQALASDPGKEQRIAAMSSHEKMSSLDVLRDQRQRVLGYISEAQKERRLEDAMSLQASLGDLDVELSLIERSL